MPRKSKEQKQREARTKATTKYKAKTYKQVKIELHLIKDIDIINALENALNKTEFIKDCIRKNI